MSDQPEFDRESVVNLLKEVANADRLVIEFQNIDGEIQAADITDHVDMLEQKVNNAGE